MRFARVFGSSPLVLAKARGDVTRARGWRGATQRHDRGVARTEPRAHEIACLVTAHRCERACVFARTDASATRDLVREAHVAVERMVQRSSEPVYRAVLRMLV